MERLFLIIFISLFFLMSFGINGIGLYYWYFTTVDKVDESSAPANNWPDQ